MKKTTILQLTLVLTIFVGFACSASAISVAANLTLTEVSDTELDWTWNGGASNGGTQSGMAFSPANTIDNWDFSIPNAQIVTTLGGTQDVFVYWKEPDYATSGLVNDVRFFQYGPAANGSQVTVFSSDGPQSQGYPLVNDFGIYTQNFSDGLTAQYNDPASIENVPDSGTTAVLFIISGAVLVGFQLRRARLPV